MQASGWLQIGAVLGGLAVALGAFGAHWLEGAVQQLASDRDQQQRLLEVWETAVRYQMYHALAIVVVGLWQRQNRSRWLTAAGWAFVLGTLIFSGMLYALVLTGMTWLGAVVPIGGTAFIVGWVLLAAGCGQSKQPAREMGAPS